MNRCAFIGTQATPDAAIDLAVAARDLANTMHSVGDQVIIAGVDEKGRVGDIPKLESLYDAIQRAEDQASLKSATWQTAARAELGVPD